MSTCPFPFSFGLEHLIGYKSFHISPLARGIPPRDMMDPRQVAHYSSIDMEQNKSRAFNTASGTGAVAHACNPSTLAGRRGGSRGQEIETILANTVKPHLY